MTLYACFLMQLHIVGYVLYRKSVAFGSLECFVQSRAAGNTLKKILIVKYEMKKKCSYKVIDSHNTIARKEGTITESLNRPTIQKQNLNDKVYRFCEQQWMRFKTASETT